MPQRSSDKTRQDPGAAGVLSGSSGRAQALGSGIIALEFAEFARYARSAANLQSRLNAAPRDPFDPFSAPCGSHEWIRKVLCFPRNLVAHELHDAHVVGRLAVICQGELGDPKITAANDSLDSKPLFARLTSALVLYIAFDRRARSPDCGYSKHPV